MVQPTNEKPVLLSGNLRPCAVIAPVIECWPSGNSSAMLLSVQF